MPRKVGYGRCVASNHVLLINWPAWYLLAFDHSRGEPRTFRVDRFLTVEVERTMFRARPREIVQALVPPSGVVLERV